MMENNPAEASTPFPHSPHSTSALAKAFPLPQTRPAMPPEDYHPNPIDGSGFQLNADLQSLTEKLAENAHDLWARERMAQGWTWGPQRDDGAKKHPCLIPYADLPESEKKFDRETAMGTVRAILALGHSINPPKTAAATICSTQKPDSACSTADPLTAWTESLKAEFANVTARKSNSVRKWTFDMDDAPEIESLPAAEFKVARGALDFLQQTIFPEWKRSDAEAIRRQRWHKFIATTAIAAGISAIVCAILQLVMERLSQETKHLLGHIEVTAILVAAIAVGAGVILHFHHGWLASRQKAERLRVLKFRSLAWRELWCDFEAWKNKVRQFTEALGNLDSAAAKKWAQEEESGAYVPDHLGGCEVSTHDLRALAALHQIKRLSFQRYYFQFQSEKATPRSRIADWKIGMWLFFITVIVVLVHRLHLHPEGAVFDAWLIGLAALLPVIGFGLRAWLAAFETPRSRNLFRAKARALDHFLLRGEAATSDPEQFRSLVADGEDVFINEHREWYRLQLEAEWFV